MSRRRHIILIVVTTVLAVALVIPEALAGSMWAWMLMVIVISAPIGAAMEIRELRRAGEDAAADAGIRLASALIATVAVVVLLGQQMVQAAAEDCPPAPGQRNTDPSAQ